MGILSVLPSDLQTFMGSDTIDATRATFIIDQVTRLASTVVTPLTDTAMPIILTAAARAYASSPGSPVNETVGPYHVQMAAGGLYLTRSERAALRRSAGGGGAFSYSLIPSTYVLPGSTTNITP